MTTPNTNNSVQAEPPKRFAVTLEDGVSQAAEFYATQGALSMVLSKTGAILSAFIKDLTDSKMAQLKADSDAITDYVKSGGKDPGELQSKQQAYNSHQLEWDQVIQPSQTAQQTNQSAQTSTTNGQGGLARDMGALTVVWQIPQSQ